MSLATLAFSQATQALDSVTSSAHRMPAEFASKWLLQKWRPSTVALRWCSGRFTADIGIAAEALFDLFSTARSAPQATFYVATTGSDGAAGSQAAPFASIWKAISAANTAGVPSKIIVAAGLYYRANTFTNGNPQPAVDLAILATGGRVVTGVFDSFSAPSADATYANTYSMSLSNVDLVVDLIAPNAYGNYSEMKRVATPAICNLRPGTFAVSGGTLYINRVDGAQPTVSNTRIYRATANTFTLGANGMTSCFIGGVTDADGFDLEGSSSTGVLGTVYGATVPTQEYAIVVKNCSFKYAGGAIQTGARCVSIDSLNGLSAFFNCRADASVTDAFNFHQSKADGRKSYAVTVNCTSSDVGLRGQASSNNWTSHEDVVAIDAGGAYADAAGGSCRTVGTGYNWFVGTNVVNDRGDKASGGTVPPSAFNAENSVKMWVDRPIVTMPAGEAYDFYTQTAGPTISYRNYMPRRSGGAGSVVKY